MSWLSDKDADALRNWFQVTLTLHSDAGVGVAVPRRPLGMMLLVYLALRPGHAASYAQLREVFELENVRSALTEAIKPLEERGMLSSRSTSDGTGRELSLTKLGRDVVGKLIHTVSKQPNLFS